MTVVALGRGDVADYVAAFSYVLSLLILAYIVLSLIRSFARLPYSPALDRVEAFLRSVAEPILAPFRRILPMFGPLDLSPIVALIALRIVTAIVVGLIRG